MHKKLEELSKRVPAQHKDLSKYTQHVFEALENMVEEHRRVVASDALAGIKPNGHSEHEFYQHINELKAVLLKELEKTVEDIEHLGQKGYEKHYKDGIKE